jgi:HEAT repeats/HEAT repeat
MLRKWNLLWCVLLALLPSVAQAQESLPPELSEFSPLKPVVWEVYLKSKSVDIRRAAASRLVFQATWGVFDPSDGPVLALGTALGDTDREVRCSAAVALRESGSKAKKALPKLVALTTSPDKELRTEVFRAIVSIGPEAKHAPLLLNGLKDKEKYIRLWSAVGLLMVNHPDTEPNSHIVDALSTKDDTFLQESFSAFCVAKYSALPLLERLMTDKDSVVRRRASGAIGRIAGCTETPFPFSVIKQLERSLKDDDITVVGKSLDALACLGERAKDSLPAVTACLKHSDSDVRYWAAQTLPSFGKAGLVAIPALEAALDDKNEYVRKEAADSLRRLRELAEESPKKSEKDP